MNDERACEILGICDPLTDDIKRAYRIKLLRSHPDKNPRPDAAEQFISTQAAYAYLQSKYGTEEPEVDSAASSGDDEDENDDGNGASEGGGGAAWPTQDPQPYSACLRSFLSTILEEELAEKASPLLTKLCAITLEKAWKYGAQYVPFWKTINRPTLKLIYKILVKYGDVLHADDTLIRNIEKILREPYADEFIVLNPFLEDLLSEENVYVLKYQDRPYYVPLWHHDMVFDHCGRDLLVKCYPMLPTHMQLDERNVLYVQLQYRVAELWNRHEIVVPLTSKHSVHFDPQTLKLTATPQYVVLPACGVPLNNVSDMMNCQVRQDVVLCISLQNPT